MNLGGKPRRFRRAEVDEALACLKHEDLQLLRWVLRYPFCRAEDLAQARSMKCSTIYRHLSFLQDLGVVESMTAATLGPTSCSLSHLSNLGIHWVATYMHRSANGSGALLPHRRREPCSRLYLVFGP